MANIRRLKKDIAFVASEVIIECFTYNFLFPEKNQEALASIISESLTMHSDFIKEINQVKATDDNPAKKQFGKIREKFNIKLNELVDKLEKLEKE